MNSRPLLIACALPILLGESVGRGLFSQILVVGHDGNPVALNSTVNLGNVPQETPTSFAFTLGNVKIGNSGSLSVTAVSRTGTAAADYAVLNTFPFSIPANSDATLRLRLTPSASGERRATLSIKSTGDPNPYAFTIKATALPAALQCDGRTVKVDAELTPTVGGSFVTGTTTATEADGYHFQVARTAKYFFSLCAPNAESRPGARLCLFDSTGAVVAQDDQTCPAGGEISPTLDPGDYVLAISQQIGDYKLVQHLTPLCGGRVVDHQASLRRVGIRTQTLEGTVTPALASGALFSISGDAPCVFTLCREGGAASFPTRICVFDDEGNILAENDDHCGGKSEVVMTLETGRYLVAVGTPAGPGGDFTLAYFRQVECDGSPLQIVGDLALSITPRTVSGTLPAGVSHGYRFDTTDTELVDFSFCADGAGASFDSKLCLFKDSGEVLAQDDDTCGVGARIRSKVHSVDAPLLAVSGPGGGSYTLSYLGVSTCVITTDDFQFQGEIAPDATKRTAEKTQQGQIEHLYPVHAAQDATYVFTFCDDLADSDTRMDLCLSDGEGKPALAAAGACGPGRADEIRGALPAGDYVLSVAHLNVGNAHYKLVYFAEGFAEGRFRRCDFDCSGGLSITDPVATLGFLFLGSAPACCPQVEDCDGSGIVNIGDAVFALTFLFNGGPPPAFFPDCAESGCTGYPCGG